MAKDGEKCLVFRVPDFETPARRAARTKRASVSDQRAFLESFDRQVAELAARDILPYQWTTDDDEIAHDAIMVGIGDDSPTLIAAELSPVETTANVTWTDRIYQGDKIEAASEGPYTVPQALERAEVLRAQWGVKRVVILLQDRATWQADWGQLREIEGLN
mgnify:CR=1 FL=1